MVVGGAKGGYYIKLEYASCPVSIRGMLLGEDRLTLETGHRLHEVSEVRSARVLPITVRQ
jgi:hypothetical protein